MSAIDLSFLTPYLRNGENFEITAEQYLQGTNKELPAGKYYIEKRSPIARTANAEGYSVQVVERIQKVLIFEKRR